MCRLKYGYPIRKTNPRQHFKMMHGETGNLKMILERIFYPSSVAIVGASRDPEKIGHIILKNMIDAGYTGRIAPINPKAEEILKLKAYPSLSKVPSTIDLAVIAIPAHLVGQALKECNEKRIKAAVIISGGFREIGKEGKILEDEICKVAKSEGIRIIGPNCQGINNTHTGLCATWPLAKCRGSMSIITQSGTLGAAFSCWAETEGVGISKCVNLGNKIDLDELDFLRYFGEDEDTKVISLYIEGVSDGREFIKIASEITKKKPIVALKGGRTSAGSRAVSSHTGSLAGSDRIFDGAFKQTGVLRAKNLEEFYDFSKALSLLPLPEGDGVLIITSSGGSGILAADACEDFGLTLSQPAEKAIERLRTKLPSRCTFGNPFDLTMASAEEFRLVIEENSNCPEIHGFIVIFGDPIVNAAEEMKIASKHVKKPILVAYLGGGEVENNERTKMHSMAIPVFPSPERAVAAYGALVKYSEFRRRTGNF